MVGPRWLHMGFISTHPLRLSGREFLIGSKATFEQKVQSPWIMCCHAPLWVTEFSYIHDKKRNKLGTEKGGRLVHIHHNLRVMNELERFDYIEPAVEWGD